MHFCARAGNTDILMEIVKDLGPTRTQSAVNKQAKVLTLSVKGLYQQVRNMHTRTSMHSHHGNHNYRFRWYCVL